ncbi:MAG: hypothetical protein KZQ63_05645, partial [Candidatus Thiodiazotropha sp. (ex Lucinoma aequizonata)]|nr:hypothetical protein [Candidatus Thiodiazotropha sp. (ex Lucinoma aequizonata)]
MESASDIHFKGNKLTAKPDSTIKYGTGKSGGNGYFDISYLKLENTEMKIVLLNQEDAPPGNLI